MEDHGPSQVLGSGPMGNGSGLETLGISILFNPPYQYWDKVYIPLFDACGLVFLFFLYA